MSLLYCCVVHVPCTCIAVIGRVCACVQQESRETCIATLRMRSLKLAKGARSDLDSDHEDANSQLLLLRPPVISISLRESDVGMRSEAACWR